MVVAVARMGADCFIRTFGSAVCPQGLLLKTRLSRRRCPKFGRFLARFFPFMVFVATTRWHDAFLVLSLVRWGQSLKRGRVGVDLIGGRGVLGIFSF